MRRSIGALYGAAAVRAFIPGLEPETSCPAFECENDGEVAVQTDFGARKPYTHGGCDPMVFSILAMDPKNMDPSNMMGGNKNANKSKLDKCCAWRELCFQTCGRTKKDCEDSYKACVKKKCKSNSQCESQGNMATIFGSMGLDMLGGKDKDEKAGKCREYANAQKDNCQCVPKKKKDEKFVDSIASFYKAFQKSKLPKDGDNKKWVESVVKKPFPGKPDQDVWAALFQKYWYRFEKKERPNPLGGLGDMGGLGGGGGKGPGLGGLGGLDDLDLDKGGAFGGMDEDGTFGGEKPEKEEL